MSQINLYQDLDARFFYRTNVGRGEETKVRKLLILQTSPRMASLRQGMCSFIPHCHPQMDRVLNKGIFSQAKGQNSLKQTIMYVYNNKNKEKQVKKNSSNMESKLAFPCNMSFLGILLTHEIKYIQNKDNFFLQRTLFPMFHITIDGRLSFYESRIPGVLFLHDAQLLKNLTYVLHPDKLFFFPDQ